MVNPTIVVCLLIVLPVAYLVMVKPLFLDKSESYFLQASEKQEFDTSLSLLETISELETDYKMGKLSREDYDALSLEYKRVYLEEQQRNEK